jgi:predicted alpha/beta hydrolase family esterase
MQFLLIHGSFGSPKSSWLPTLKTHLESLNQTVLVPQFPVDDWDALTKSGPESNTKHQNLTSWLSKFEETQKDFKINEPICVVAHSIGPLFVLHAVLRYNLTLDSAIFVAPFLEKLNKTWQIDAANKTFYHKNFNFNKLKQLIPVSYVLYGNNDPYVDSHFSLEFAQQLNSSVIEVKGGGHMNSESGYLDFPLVYDLCRTRIG